MQCIIFNGTILNMNKHIFFGVILFGMFAFPLLSQPIGWKMKTFQDSVFEVNNRVCMPKIEFGLGRCNLRPEGMDSLIPVKSFLLKHSSLKVEVGAFTDHVDPNSSQRYTFCRARSVRDSLVNMGIDPGRITYNGYGASHPFVLQNDLVLPSGAKLLKGTGIDEHLYEQFATNKTDLLMLKALNRRTELKIIAIE
jgi:outer membrane protein OmpA-like peptidoglycan-associated protein